MLRQTIITLLLLLSISVLAQKTEKIYFGKSGERKPDSINAAYYRIIEYDLLGNILPKLNEYYISGQLKETGTCHNPIISSCILNGLITMYYKNGTKSAEIYYENNRPSGSRIEWREDGTLYSSSSYKNGMRDGELKVYHNDGKTIKRIEQYTESKSISGKCFNEKGEEIPFYVFSQPATYVGGLKEMGKFIQENMKYPKAAKKEKIEGKVMVKFTIDTSGYVTNITIAESLHPLLDAEAIRVISMLPKWIPAISEGRKLNMNLMLPINFNLP